MKKRIIALTIVFMLALSLVVVAQATVPAAPASITLSSTTGKISGVTTQMEYRINTTGAWTAVTSNAEFTPTAGSTYEFRYKAVGSLEPSVAATIVVPAAGTTPAGITYANGKISGLTTAMEYNRISATHTVWTKCTAATLTVTTGDTEQKYYFRTAATSGASASAVTTITIPVGATSDGSGIKLKFATEQFTGFGSGGGGWKYTTFGPSYTGEFLHDIAADTMQAIPGQTYYFRKIGDSSATAIKSPLRPAAPAGITYNATAAKLEGLTDRMRWRLREGAVVYDWNAVASGTTIAPLAQTSATQTVEVSFAPTETAYGSFHTSLTVWRQSTVDSRFNAVRYEGGKILGLTAEMEYIIGSDTSLTWTSCTAEPLKIERTEADQTVSIRLKADPTKVETIIVPFVLPKPDVILDLVNGEITGLNPALTYMYKASSWKKIEGALLSEDKTTFLIGTLLKGRAIALGIAQAPASGSPDPDSVTTLDIGAAPTKPKLSVTSYKAEDETLGVAVVTGYKDIQYREEFSETWSTPALTADPIELPVGYTAGTYVFRVAPTATAQGSAEVKVKVAAPAKPAVPKVDYKKEIITIKGDTSYTLNGVEWLTVAKSSKVELKLEGLYGSVIKVRAAVTAKKPASLITTVNILPRISTPPTNADVYIMKIKGKDTVVMRTGARQVEYLDGSKWKKGVPKYATVKSGVVSIRFMADAQYGPSEIVTLTENGI